MLIIDQPATAGGTDLLPSTTPEFEAAEASDKTIQAASSYLLESRAKGGLTCLTTIPNHFCISPV